MTAVLESSYRLCGRRARQARSSFYPCFFLLPREKRRAMTALYAFLRHVDDLADSDEPAPRRREALDHCRGQVEAHLAGRADPQPDDILPALADAAARFAIPSEHLFAVLDGVAMDLDLRVYATFDDLATYCRRVASAVGWACIHVWGFEGRDAYDLADRCGLAFQLTNIVRDLAADAARGRVYVPSEDLQACGYAPEGLARGVADDAFDRLVAMEIDRARGLYREGAALFDRLARDGRRIFGMMFSVYRRLLEALSREPRAILSRRVSVGRATTLRLALRWALLPPRRSSLA